MSAIEFRRLLKTKKPLYGWVKWSEEDGAYVGLNKRELLKAIRPESTANYLVKDNSEAIYIN